MTIRKLEINDLPLRVKWMNNPRIYSSMHYEIPIELHKTLDWYKQNQVKENRLDIVICDTDNSIIAFGGYVSIDNTIYKAETYLFVDPERIGQGLGSKAKHLMIEYAFNKLNFNKLYVITNEDNFASIRIQEKFGYKLEGRFREEYLTSNGILKDRLYFGLLKNDWKNK